MKKKVLITGAAGFLGTYIVREMFENGWDVLALDARPKKARHEFGISYKSLVLPNGEAADVIASFAPDTCVHCAGRASVGESVKNPQADFNASVLVTAALLDALADVASGCRTVFLSSAAVYGQPESLPVTEDAKTRPLSPYGYHKRICELLMEQASRLRGVPTATLRIFSAYGPGLKRQVLWEIATQFAENGKAILKGSGQESRDFIHAADVAKAVRLVVEKAPCEGESYNLGTEQETSIRDAAKQLGGFFGASEAIAFEGKQMPENPERWVADCARIRKLGFLPEISLEKGLRGLAEWVSK